MAFVQLNGNGILPLTQLNGNGTLAIAQLDDNILIHLNATKTLEQLEILPYSEKIFEFCHEEQKYTEKLNILCEIFIFNLGEFENFISGRKTYHSEDTAFKNVLYILNDEIHFHLANIGIQARVWINGHHSNEEYKLFIKYINDIIYSCFDVCDFRSI
jgi:hypothetical protein